MLVFLPKRLRHLDAVGHDVAVPDGERGGKFRLDELPLERLDLIDDSLEALSPEAAALAV